MGVPFENTQNAGGFSFGGEKELTRAGETVGHC